MIYRIPDHIHSRTGRIRGFSLVELMVSMAILSTLMVLLFGFFDQATKAWQSSEKKIDAFREARAAFYYLRRDLSNIVVSESIKWAFFEDTANLLNESNLPPQNHGDALLFVSSVSPDGQDQDNNKSDLCLVGYYLAYRQSDFATNRRSFNLYRYFKSSDPTWVSPGEAMSDPAGVQNGLLAFINGNSTSLSTLAYEPPGPSDDILARNVIDFQVTPLNKDLTEFISTPGQLYDEQPALMEISLTAFNFDTAQKLDAPSKWYSGSAADEAIRNRNAQRFTVRIPIR